MLYITILIIWKRTPSPIGWSLGVCASCGGLSAMRVEQWIETISIWFIPISRSVVGTGARCDFCRRPSSGAVVAGEIGLDQWQPNNGLDSLARNLDADATRLPRQGDEKQRLQSLVGSIKAETSVDQIDISLGLTTGLILGGLVGFLAGMFVIPRFHTGMDEVGNAFVGVSGGLVVGALIGGLIEVLVKRRSLPFKRLSEVYQQYGFSTSTLEPLAAASCSRVKRPALRLQHELAFTINRR